MKTKLARFRSMGVLSLRVLCASFLFVLAPDILCAQAPPATPSSKGDANTTQPVDKSLVDGLLNLVDEAEANKENSQPEVNPSTDASENAGRGMNPLVLVRQSMKTAAVLLQQGTSDQQAVDVQTKIVSQLDQLISELEQQQKQQQSQKGSKQPSQQVQQQRAQNQDSEQSKSSKPSRQSLPKQPGEKGIEAGKQPGDQDNQSLDSELRRNDPAALQQNVWGHLPEKVRSQMQSRMVEEFLPSYRQHIEAYYRSLLQDDGKQ
jgi:hypothetical protein